MYIKQHTSKPNINSYFRYIDNTFILFNETSHQANNLLSNINKNI